MDHPYADEVRQRNEEVITDASTAADHEPWELDVQGIVAQEILRVLRLEGRKSIARLAREVAHLDTAGAAQYAEALYRAGLVKFGQTSRGSRTIELV